MREIKFRVWNPEKKIMENEAEEINVNGSDIISEIISGRLRAKYMKSSGLWVNAEIMQYTGLKDKNGKEIYEGDIAISTYGKCRVINEEGLTRTGIVLYDKETASFRLSVHNSVVLVSFYDVNKIEVIGNIYENPELLEGGQA